MTNDQGWQSPSPSGQPADQPVSPWVSSTPPPNQHAAPSWAPPPKPGLIPLRPLSFGTIIGSSFRVMRRNPAPTFGLSVLLYGVITVVFTAVLVGVIFVSFGRFSSASYQDQGDILAGGFGLIAVSMIIPIALTVVATGLLQGIISLEVSRATLGEKLRISGLWRLAKGRVAPLVGWSFLLTAAIVVFFAITAGVSIGLLALASAGAADPLAVALGSLLLSVVFSIAFAVVGAWLGTKLSLVPSIIMLERLTLGASIARSWTLIRGSFWRTLGTQLLIGVIIYAASYIISIPISIVASILSVLVNPNMDSGASAATFIVLLVVSGMISVVVGAVGLVMQSSSLALIYIDIRMRREGLDLELMHYVEARQTGRAGVDNPYLRLQSGAYTAQPASGSPWA